MNVSKEEVIHMANLASLNLTENEIEKYTKDMEEIIAFANTIKNVNTENINESIIANETYNVFRKDEVKEFGNLDALLQNAPEKEQNMFKIPKVIN